MTGMGLLGYGPDMAQTSDVAVSEVRVTTTSGVVVRSEPDLHAVISTGRSVAVVTTSGKVSVEDAVSADIRTRSGKVDVDVVTGECRIIGGGGRVTVDRCGSADVTTGIPQRSDPWVRHG